MDILEDGLMFPKFLLDFTFNMTTKYVNSVIFTATMKQKQADEQGHRYAEIFVGEIAELLGKHKSARRQILARIKRYGLDRVPEKNQLHLSAGSSQRQEEIFT